MRWLCLIVEPKLRAALLEGPLLGTFRLEGFRFTQRPTSRDVVFYDWIVDHTDAVRGLEIHLPPDAECVRTDTPFEQLPHVDADYFVRVWFSSVRGCFQLGREAFGDIFFYEADGRRLAVVVGVDEWLSQRERDRLLSDLGIADTAHPTRRGEETRTGSET